MKRNIKITAVGLGIIIFFAVCLTGCEIRKTSEEKLKDLEFTVCDEHRLPEELVDIIQEKKTEPFKMTYKTKDYMYIVLGYGAEDRKDVSVRVSELYLTENAIFIETSLVADDEKTMEEDMVSYPWIAVKCQLYDKPVVFQ